MSNECGLPVSANVIDDKWAFPSKHPVNIEGKIEGTEVHHGMSKRLYVATEILKVIIQSGDINLRREERVSEAFKYADLMLEV